LAGEAELRQEEDSEESDKEARPTDDNDKESISGGDALAVQAKANKKKDLAGEAEFRTEDSDNGSECIDRRTVTTKEDPPLVFQRLLHCQRSLLKPENTYFLRSQSNEVGRQ
jgi:hypothetical protein